MRITCTIEWMGHRAGWQATAELRGKPVTVSNQKSFSLARKRLKAALEGAGVQSVELEVLARMPKTIESDLNRYREVAKQIPKLEAELEELKLRLAQRLCTELNFSEREVGIWLGVSGAHISAKRRANTIDTGEYLRPDRDDDENDGEDDERPAESR